MKRLVALSVAVGISLITGTVAGAPIEISNAASVGTTVRDCRSAAARAAGQMAPDRCDDRTGMGFEDTIVDQRYDTTYGGVTASVVSDSPLGHGTRGGIDASGNAGAIMLRQAAMTTSPYARTSSMAVALQSFRWDGSGGTSRAIGGHLDFSATHLKDQAGFDDQSPGSLIVAQISVFSLASSTFSYDADGTLGFEAAVEHRPDYQHVAHSLFLSGIGDPHDWFMKFSLEHDRTYFIGAYFQIWAKFGAAVDATHTFRATLGEVGSNGEFVAGTDGLYFSLPSDNPITMSNNVPEPTSLMLFIAAVIALGASMARRPRLVAHAL